MKHLGIEVSVKHVPELDPGFLPLGKFNAAFLKDAKQPLDVAVERAVARWPSIRPLSTAPRRWLRPTSTMWTGSSKCSCG